MKQVFETVDEYILNCNEYHKEAIVKLRSIILENLPSGFEETISYNTIGYLVPKTIYPAGYHCNPKLPLPFINLASQKNYITMYHLGIYAMPDILNWFTSEINTKYVEMGKGCIKFKKTEHIPFELIAQLVLKISLNEWINVYENTIKK